MTDVDRDELTDSERYLWRLRHELLERVQLSVLYHRKRERFFDWWDKVFKGIAILGGSSAVAQLGGVRGTGIAAAAAAVGSTLSLVFGLAERSRRHADLAARFLALESEVVGTGERDYTEHQLANWNARVRSIESEEPTTLSGLVTLCHREIARSNGIPDTFRHLNWWQRLTINYFDHAPARPSRPENHRNAA